jgi:RNA-binding protein 26
MRVRDVDATREWLLNRLEPLVEVEPGALADYVLALLRQDVAPSELRSQLEDFLKEGARRPTQ